jgi:hypothetical protein
VIKRFVLLAASAALAGVVGCGGPTTPPGGADTGVRPDTGVIADTGPQPDTGPPVDGGIRDTGVVPGDGSMPDSAVVTPDGGGACDGVDCTAFDDDCNVGTCDAATGACSATPRATGTSCDDGDACTDGDSCNAGSCESGTPADCSASDDMCNIGVCDPTDGTCGAMPRTDGTVCEDGSLCTGAGVCTAGVCGGAIPTDCSAMSDMCNVGACDAATGACVAMPVAAGTACSDGNLCTTGEVCSAGACGGGVAPDCSGSADMCNTGACDPGTGACIAVPVAGGTACDDGVACTTADVCTAGVCGGTTLDCSSLTSACSVGSCSAATGACVATPRPDGTTCDDALSCSPASACRAGSCAPVLAARFDFEAGVTHEWTMTGGTAGWITGAGGRTGNGFFNADISDSQNARTQMDVVYATAGTVSFWRATDTEGSFDFLRFFVDGVERQAWSGVNGFAQFTYPIAAGAHVFEWRYTKDGSVSTAADRVIVDDIELVGGSTRQTFERGIPATFVNSGAGWISSAVAQSGTQAMQNADIGDGGTATTTTTVRLPAAGSISFFRRTDTESSFDFLRFSIDGTQVGSWSGVVAYSQVSFPLTAGTHTLSWSYTKDGSVSTAADAVYVDNIDVTVGSCARGSTVLIGHDFFARSADIDQILGNAVQLTTEPGNIEILSYTQFADNSAGGEVANARAAITAELTAAARTATFTTLADSTMLATALTATVDVLLINEQEAGTDAGLTAVGTAWNAQLQAFLDRGGIIIVMTFLDPSWRIVNGPGLFTITGIANVTSATMTVADPASRLAAGVPATYSAPDGSSSYTGLVGGTTVVRAAVGAPVVQILPR